MHVTIQERTLRGELDAALEGVHGFLQGEKAWELHERVRTFPGGTPISVVEIGSWKGRSTIAIGLALKARHGSGVVHAIDPHRGSPELLRIYGEIDTFAEFLSNLDASGVRDVVDVLRLSSHEARSRFNEHSAHILFIDGLHEYQDVLRDIEDWIPVLTDRAVVVFDDTSCRGVFQAVREHILVRRSPFYNPQLVGGTLFMDFDRNRNWRGRDTAALAWLRLILRCRHTATRFVRWSPAPARKVIQRAGNALSNRVVRKAR